MWLCCGVTTYIHRITFKNIAHQRLPSCPHAVSTTTTLALTTRGGKTTFAGDDRNVPPLPFTRGWFIVSLSIPVLFLHLESGMLPFDSACLSASVILPSSWSLGYPALPWALTYRLVCSVICPSSLPVASVLCSTGERGNPGPSLLQSCEVLRAAVGPLRPHTSSSCTPFYLAYPPCLFITLPHKVPLKPASIPHPHFPIPHAPNSLFLWSNSHFVRALLPGFYWMKELDDKSIWMTETHLLL